MSSRNKILVLTQDAESKYNFEKLITSSPELKAAVGEEKIKYANFESFQEGKRQDKYDFVIMFTNEMTADDIEMSEEFYKHYSLAPVVSWVVATADDVSTIINSFNDKSHIEETADGAAGAVQRAIEWC